MRFFFPLPPQFFILFSLSWGSSRGIWWCLKRRGAQMCMFGLEFSGCRVEAPGGLPRKNENGGEKEKKERSFGRSGGGRSGGRRSGGGRSGGRGSGGGRSGGGGSGGGALNTPTTHTQRQHNTQHTTYNTQHTTNNKQAKKHLRTLSHTKTHLAKTLKHLNWPKCVWPKSAMTRPPLYPGNAYKTHELFGTSKFGCRAGKSFSFASSFPASM